MKADAASSNLTGGAIDIDGINVPRTKVVAEVKTKLAQHKFVQIIGLPGQSAVQTKNEKPGSPYGKPGL